MVEKGPAFGFENSSYLLEIRGEIMDFRMDERLETEHEIHALIFLKREGSAVAHMTLDRGLAEPVPADLDAAVRDVHKNQPLTVGEKKVSPSTLARTDFQDRPGGELPADSWIDTPVPLVGGASPFPGPNISAMVRPVEAIVPEGVVLLNRRHAKRLSLGPLHRS